MSRNRSSKQRKTREGQPPSGDTIDELNIRGRVCGFFQEDPEAQEQVAFGYDKICICGRQQSAHKDRRGNTNNKWTVSRNTLEQIDPEHGLIGEKSLFVRLDIHTPLEKVERLLLDTWKIPKPRFIVSIIGGAKYFKLNDRLETNFINGIVDIAKKSDAWLFTNGYDSGIVQLVGRAINKFRLIEPNKILTVIGICKWGCIANIQSLINPPETRSDQIYSRTATSTGRKTRRAGEWDLERNHSHYLMLDDGKTRRYDLGDYRTQLAIHMARLKHDDDVTTPVVTVAVEGGKDTIANVYYDLRANVPVVLINGSGRAADFFTRWLMYTEHHKFNEEDMKIIYGLDELDAVMNDLGDSKNTGTKRNSSSSNGTSHEVHLYKEKLENMFEKYRERIEDDLQSVALGGKVDENLIRQVMYCLQPSVRSDITIFNLNSDSDLSETILRSICGSRQKLNQRNLIERDAELDSTTMRTTTSKKFEQHKRKSYYLVSEKAQKTAGFRLLKLAIDWNCVDVAREFIFKNSLDNILKPELIFLEALKNNCSMFVYEFLKLKIDLCKVFPNSESSKHSQYKSFIESLYTKEFVNNSQQHHLKSFMNVDKQHKEVWVNSVEILNRIFIKLIGDYMHELYYDTLKDEQSDRYLYGLKTTQERYLSDEEKRQIMRTYFLRDLFLWSIVMNYADMAKVLLSFMDYRICPALIATKIFKEYQRKAPYGDLQKSYTKSIEYFEQYAIDSLGQCDDRDPDKACEIILQRNELYGYVTCLQVAYDADDKTFLSAPCCIEAVNNIWYNKLYPDQSDLRPKAYIALGLLTFGLAAPPLVLYRRAKKEIKSIDRSKRTVKSNGIDYCEPADLEYAVPPSSEPVWKRYFMKWYKFQQSIPMKFFYHFITYLFFLLLFSYVLLFKFDPPTVNTPSIDWTEILTIILVTCMLIEEINYFFRQPNLTFFGKVAKYFTQLFKFITFFGFLLFYIGLIVRFTYANSQVDFTAARIIMALDVEIWWLRSLSFIIIFPLLGPHLVSIGKMLKDLLFFMCIIAVVMIGYGVSTRSMAYYPKDNPVVTRGNYPVDTSFDGRSVFRQIMYPVYYLMYGEFGTEFSNLDNNPDAGWSIATYVLLAIHMMLVNILLINLLIALFSKRFEQVYEQTQKIWYSQNCAVTREYYMRAPFFLPFSLFYDIFSLCRMCFYYLRRKCGKQPDDKAAKAFQIIPEEDSPIIDEWREFEKKFTYEYAHNEVKTLKDALIKSSSGIGKKTNERNPAVINIERNTNAAIDGLKQVEDELSNLNSIINKKKSES